MTVVCLQETLSNFTFESFVVMHVTSLNYEKSPPLFQWAGAHKLTHNSFVISFNHYFKRNAKNYFLKLATPCTLTSRINFVRDCGRLGDVIADPYVYTGQMDETVYLIDVDKCLMTIRLIRIYKQRCGVCRSEKETIWWTHPMRGN